MKETTKTGTKSTAQLYCKAKKLTNNKRILIEQIILKLNRKSNVIGKAAITAALWSPSPSELNTIVIRNIKTILSIYIQELPFNPSRGFC